MLDGFQLIDVHLHAARKTTLKLPWDTWVQCFADRDVMDRLYDSSGAVIPAAFDALLAAEGVDTGLLMCEYSPKVTGLQTIEDMLPIAGFNPDRVKVIANVQGLTQVFGSSTVTAQSTLHAPTGVKRSIRRNESALALRYVLLGLKLVVSTTSVLPSQCPRGSPRNVWMPGVRCGRPSSGMMRVSWIIS